MRKQPPIVVAFQLTPEEAALMRRALGRGEKLREFAKRSALAVAARETNSPPPPSLVEAASVPTLSEDVREAQMLGAITHDDALALLSSKPSLPPPPASGDWTSSPEEVAEQEREVERARREAALREERATKKKAERERLDALKAKKRAEAAERARLERVGAAAEPKLRGDCHASKWGKNARSKVPCADGPLWSDGSTAYCEAHAREYMSINPFGPRYAAPKKATKAKRR